MLGLRKWLRNPKRKQKTANEMYSTLPGELQGHCRKEGPIHDQPEVVARWDGWHAQPVSNKDSIVCKPWVDECYLPFQGHNRELQPPKTGLLCAFTLR